jgi:hypothetical protein
MNESASTTTIWEAKQWRHRGWLPTQYNIPEGSHECTCIAIEPRKGDKSRAHPSWRLPTNQRNNFEATRLHSPSATWLRCCGAANTPNHPSQKCGNINPAVLINSGWVPP